MVSKRKVWLSSVTPAPKASLGSSTALQHTPLRSHERTRRSALSSLAHPAHADVEILHGDAALLRCHPSRVVLVKRLPLARQHGPRLRPREVVVLWRDLGTIHDLLVRLYSGRLVPRIARHGTLAVLRAHLKQRRTTHELTVEVAHDVGVLGDAVALGRALIVG
eukprot:scaffold76391_cov60-Phaeocystis_antarctica.AAC.4